MTDQNAWPRVTAKRAREICAHYRTGDEARALLASDPGPHAFLQALVQQQRHGDAIRFLAHALPAREAVWWGALCLWRAADSRADKLPSVQREALRASVVWVLEPSEEHRRGAEKAGRQATLECAAGCFAMAAFWSGGNMAKPGLPPVPAPPFASAKSVGGGILLASVLKGGLPSTNYQQRFVELGVQIADGKFLWDDSAVLQALPASK
jgi:uncharacterized protein DUF6931